MRVKKDAKIYTFCCFYKNSSIFL